ncbi:MAG TPA: hypothetical protein VII50_00130 [Acidothermaceae bacterium]
MATRDRGELPVTRPVRRLASAPAATVLGITAAAFAVAALVISVADHKAASAGIVLVPTTMFAAVGVVVARRQPANPIGWLLIFVSIFENMYAFVAAYVTFNHWLGHGLNWPSFTALWFENSFWDLGLIVGLPALLLFPDGVVPSPRWRPTLRLYVVGGVLVVISQCVAATILVRFHDLQVDANGQPVGTPKSAGFVAFLESGVAVLILLPLMVSWVVHLAVAFRRSEGVLRQQLKWATAGALVLVVSLAVSVPLGNDTSAVAQVVSGLCLALFGAFPLSLGLGILKYRLYDIDRLISRTLSYTVVTGLLIGVYVGVVVLTTNVLSFSSPVAVTASTLAAAALFTPIRTAAQRLVDRRFNRARYDAEATVAAFSARLRDAVDLETVRLDLLAVVSHAVEPTHASIWISPARATRAGSP